MESQYRNKNRGTIMSDDKFKRLGMIGLILSNTLIWYSIYTNGLFITITWIVILSAIVGIIIKLKENR